MLGWRNVRLTKEGDAGNSALANTRRRCRPAFRFAARLRFGTTTFTCSHRRSFAVCPSLYPSRKGQTRVRSDGWRHARATHNSSGSMREERLQRLAPGGSREVNTRARNFVNPTPHQINLFCSPHQSALQSRQSSRGRQAANYAADLYDAERLAHQQNERDDARPRTNCLVERRNDHCTEPVARPAVVCALSTNDRIKRQRKGGRRWEEIKKEDGWRKDAEQKATERRGEEESKAKGNKNASALAHLTVENVTKTSTKSRAGDARE
eukprot:1485075-Pleurochrysis_carterae.AAC.1